MDNANDNVIELTSIEKASAAFLNIISSILDAAGPPFAPARETLKKLSQAASELDPGNVAGVATALEEASNELSRYFGIMSVPGRASAGATGPMMTVDAGLATVFIDMIHNVVSVRPDVYRVEVEALERLLRSGASLEEVLRRFLFLVVQIREDVWQDRTMAYKKIGETIKSLENTEKEYIGSLSQSQTHLSAAEANFTTALEDGLREMETVVATAPDEASGRDALQALAGQVGRLRQSLEQKKEADRDWLNSLASEKSRVEERLTQTHADYDKFVNYNREVREEIEYLKKASFRDPLTGILNRRAYDIRIEEVMAGFHVQGLDTCGIIVFDIDLFRDFNNTYGHLAGDRVLTYVARLTRDALEKSDLFYRYGGDEFVVLMPGAGLGTAAARAEKIRAKINAVKFKLSQNAHETAQVTLSLGVAEIKATDTKESFFNRADQAMYEAKQAGRNLVRTRL